MFSLIIPTINRSKFIELNLELLALQKFNGQVLIGDSSNSVNYKKTSDYIKKKKLSFDIFHKHMPNLSAYECIGILSKKIKFNYVMWIPDDDFLVVKNVKKSINFLKKNKNYSACGGIISIVELNLKSNIIAGIGNGKFRPLLSKNPLDRLKDLSNDYFVAQYAISRSYEFKKRYNFCKNKLLPIIGAEVLPTFYLAAMGKVFKANNLFCIRLVHEDQILSDAAKGNLSIFDSNEYKRSIKFLISEISNFLLKYKNNKKSIVSENITLFMQIFEKNIKQKKVNKRRLFNYLTMSLIKVFGKYYFFTKIYLQSRYYFKYDDSLYFFLKMRSLIYRIFK